MYAALFTVFCVIFRVLIVSDFLKKCLRFIISTETVVDCNIYDCILFLNYQDVGKRSENVYTLKL